jgi:hypothetical protein
LFYRKTNNAIARYRTVDTSGVAISTSLNLTESHSMGAEEVLTMNLFKWWRFNASFSYYRLIQEERDDLGIPRNDNYNFNTRFTTTFTIWKKHGHSAFRQLSQQNAQHAGIYETDV